MGDISQKLKNSFKKTSENVKTLCARGLLTIMRIAEGMKG